MDLRKLALLLILISLVSCGPKDEPAPQPWFVHATDPHFFLPPPANKADEPARQARQAANEKATADLFRYIRLTSSSGSPPAFLIVTGGFGVGLEPALRKEQVDRFAKIMAASPVRQIYVVAGETDVPNGAGDDASIASFGQFIDQVRDKLSGSGIDLHNLLGCYGADQSALTGCYEDVKDSSYRLVGFPAFGFKTEHGQATYQDFDRRLEKLKRLFDNAYLANKRILLLENIPEIDDPAKLARLTIPAAAPAESQSLSLSTWDVDRHVLDEWSSLLVHPSLRGVFAGHLEDPHRQTYREPYAWSKNADYRLSFSKLFIAPPLAIDNQEGSPFQARGFTHVRLGPDKITRDLYWYDPLSASFTKDNSRVNKDVAQTQGQFYLPSWLNLPAAIRWLWEQGPQSPVERTGVLAIAIITAFLTIIALWQIPPPETGTAEAKDANQGQPTFSPFASRYGQTVLAGIGGLLVTEIAKTIGNQPPAPESRWFYIYSFIGWFIILLVLLNFFRAFTEALRFRLSSSVKSFSTAFVVFNDTFFNLIQGKNQTRTRLVEDAIITQQQSILRALETARKDLAVFIHDQLGKAACEVYVGITLLANDRSVLYYVSRNPESLSKSFPKASVAWVAVMAGEPRWFKDSYKTDKPLLDNTDNKYPALDPIAYPMKPNLQDRGKKQYHAWVVLPFPAHGRGGPARGAIHIAFSTEDCFDAVWDKAKTDQYYANPDDMWDVNIKIDAVKERLTTSERLFDQLTAGINERIFLSRMTNEVL